MRALADAELTELARHFPVARERCSVGFIDAELAAFRLHPNRKSTQPERTAEELLQVVRPYVFSRDRSLSRSKRIKLKGKWIFNGRFLKEVEHSLQRGERRWRRLLRLAWFSIQHPSVFATRSFRERLLDALSVGKTIWRPSR